MPDGTVWIVESRSEMAPRAVRTRPIVVAADLGRGGARKERTSIGDAVRDQHTDGSNRYRRVL